MRVNNDLYRALSMQRMRIATEAAMVNAPAESEAQPYAKCIICYEYLNNVDGPGRSDNCPNNCNDVVNVCAGNHLFHRGCILDSCNAPNVNIVSQMGFAGAAAYQRQSITEHCPLCKRALIPNCTGLLEKNKVSIEELTNLETNMLPSKKGGKTRKSRKSRKSRKTKGIKKYGKSKKGRRTKQKRVKN